MIYVINGKVAFDGTAGSREEFMSDLSQISYLRVNEIKKLMVLPPGEISSHYADVDLGSYVHQSLVVIETYSDLSYRGDPKGIKTFILNGLDAPRNFYSPQYEASSKSTPVYDGRATLYWNPSVRTDSTGFAKVDFFTSDRKTVLDVIVNGIEIGTGNPGQGFVEINNK